jgi:hypothetical protein
MDLTKKSIRTAKQAKAARQRAEAKVIKAVRAACVERDGVCVFIDWMNVKHIVGICGGLPELAHLGEWRRSKTRGMAPEERHHTKGCLMLCAKHHRAYDAHEFDLEYGDQGADGPLTVVKRVA